MKTAVQVLILGSEKLTEKLSTGQDKQTGEPENTEYELERIVVVQ